MMVFLFAVVFSYFESVRGWLKKAWGRLALLLPSGVLVLIRCRSLLRRKLVPG